MSRFERPLGTIENAIDLKVGDQIWQILGIWRPQFLGPYTVTRVPLPFRQHPQYDDIHEGLGDNLVFDVTWPSGDLCTHEFASDGNLQSGHSHNDNYWTRSQEAAEAVRDYLQKQWENNPELIEEEVER